MPLDVKPTVDNALVRRIASLYGLQVRRLLPVAKGYRNETHPIVDVAGHSLNLIVYKREPGILVRIKNANAVADFMASSGLPARRTADRRLLQMGSAERRRYAALYEYLPGETIPWEAYTMKHIKLLGKSMSDMHAALHAFSAQDLPDVVDEYAQVLSWMRTYFNQLGVQLALAAKLQLELSPGIFERFADLLGLCRGLPDDVQALHMDFVRSNVLFTATNDPVITGILDFEKTARGPKVFDIARTMAFLLVDCKYKQPVKVRKYFLYSGYQKRGASKLPQLDVHAPIGRVSVLDDLVEFFLLHDFYKFLRHNPYQSLPDNEHFIRTRELLLTGAILYHTS